jgi:hypothetical protein
MDKQLDACRAAQLHGHKQKSRPKLQTDAIIQTLEEADYADDDGLLTMVTLLGLQVQGYVTLHNRRESGQDRTMDGEEDVQEDEPGSEEQSDEEDIDVDTF